MNGQNTDSYTDSEETNGDTDPSETNDNTNPRENGGGKNRAPLKTFLYSENYTNVYFLILGVAFIVFAVSTVIATLPSILLDSIWRALLTVFAGSLFSLALTIWFDRTEVYREEKYESDRILHYIRISTLNVVDANPEVADDPRRIITELLLNVIEANPEATDDRRRIINELLSLTNYETDVAMAEIMKIGTIILDSQKELGEEYQDILRARSTSVVEPPPDEDVDKDDESSTE